MELAKFTSTGVDFVVVVIAPDDEEVWRATIVGEDVVTGAAGVIDGLLVCDEGEGHHSCWDFDL